MNKPYKLCLVLLSVGVLSSLVVACSTTMVVSPTISATEVIQTARVLVTVYGAQTATAYKTPTMISITKPPVAQATPASPVTQVPPAAQPTPVLTSTGAVQTRLTPAGTSPPAGNTGVNVKDAKLFIAFLSDTRSQITLILPQETQRQTAGFNAVSGGQNYTCGDLVTISNVVRILCTGPRLKSGTVAKVSFYANGVSKPVFEGSASVP